MIPGMLRSRWCLTRSINAVLLRINKSESIVNCALKTTTISFKEIHVNNLKIPLISHRNLSTGTPDIINTLKFEEVCEETLESLCEYFEDIIEKSSHLKGSDVVFGDGVLTVVFGEPYGTYVINRQTPNKQIWLSSPTSGPKRYDFVMKGDGYWIYKHDGVTLHQLLQKEINEIIKNQVDFSKCAHSLI